MSQSTPVGDIGPRDHAEERAAASGGRESGPAHPASRIRHLGWAAALMLTWPIGLALFTVWIVLVCLSPISVVSPLLIPCHTAIRWYADVHREWAGRVLGHQVRRPPGGVPTSPGLIGRVLATLRDSAAWREWCWLSVNATAGFALAALSVSLLAGSLFYLVYPLLWAVTPHEVFGTVFGVVDIHSLARAWLVTPVSIVMFALWFVTVRGLNGANARLMRALLGHRQAITATERP